MSQKKITVVQIESGKVGVSDLGSRLDGFDTTISNVNSTLVGQISGVQGEIDALETVVSNQSTETQAKIDKVNEAVMAMASAPVSTPVFNDVQTYAVQASDVTAGQPVTITIPNSKTYKVGKGNMQVLRNGIPQVLANGDYIEKTESSIEYSADVLATGDVITFIIGNPSKLNYSTAVTYYGVGADEGRIQTVTYTGDINRVITYTYNAEGKIATEAIQEDGKTTTKTFTYTGGKLTGVTAVVA